MSQLTDEQKSNRWGNFTSSGIGDLMTNAKKAGELSSKALQYIAERNMERRLGRGLGHDATSYATSWGHLVEQVAFDAITSLGYKLCSDETVKHTKINCWMGSPDGYGDDKETVFDIKCPWTMKSFCQLADCKTPADLLNANDFSYKYYWQLVSNAILTKSKYAELIVYCPYRDELDAIRERAKTLGDHEYQFVTYATDYKLPYLNRGGHYKNLNILRWEVSEADKSALTARVIEASEKLIPRTA